MATIAKTKISELATLSAATATTVIPVSNGLGTITTYKITPDNLIKDTASLAAKANLAGGNTISGPQEFTGTVNVGLALYAKADIRVDGDLILNKAEQIKFTDDSEFSMSKLYYLNDVTSDIQGQFTGLSGAIALKANSSSPTFTGTVTMPTASVTTLSVSGTATVPSGSASGHAVNKGQLDLKADKSGGNTFTGNQAFSSNVDVTGTLDVIGGVISQSYVSANSVDIIQELSMSDGATILYNTNPIPGEKLLNIKNTTSDVQAQLNAKAGIDSPAFYGTPTATTPATIDNSTRLATTEFVDKKIDAKLDRVYVVDDGINPVTSATAPGMNGRLLYNSVVKKLYRSNGADWVQIIPDTTVIYLFVSADCRDFKNKIYIWNGSEMV